MSGDKAFGEQLVSAMRGTPQQFDKAEIARRHGLPEGTHLYGETRDEAEADAAAKAALAQRDQHEAEPAGEVPFELQILAAKHAANRRLVELMHPAEGEDS